MFLKQYFYNFTDLKFVDPVPAIFPPERTILRDNYLFSTFPYLLEYIDFIKKGYLMT